MYIKLSRFKLMQGSTLKVNHWLQASIKTRPQLVLGTGPVNIWSHSCFKTSFSSRMSPDVFEINEDKMNKNKCQ